MQGTKPFEQLLGGAKRKGVRILAILAMVYGFCVLSVMLGFSYASYQQAGRMAGHPEWGFSMALFITFIFTFFTFLFSIAPLLSSARDMPMVMVLPVSSRSVFLSRFFIEWIGCLVMYLFMLAPMLVVGGASFLSVISVVIFIVEGSLFVMSLTFLLSSIGTRLFKGRMHPGTGKVLFSVLIIVIALLGSRSMTQMMAGKVDLQNLADRLSRMMAALSAFTFFARSASRPSVLFFSMFLLALGSYLCLRVSSSLFVRNYSLSQCSSGKKKGKRVRSAERSRGLVSSLERRERMIIKSQSMFQMEIYAEIAIPVILLIVYAVTGVVGELSSSFEVVKTYPKLPQAILLTFALFSSFSSVSSTSVSRQGALFFLDRTYPVPARTFVLAKVRLHLKYLCLSAQVYAFVTLAWMRLPLLHILWIAPLLLLLSFAVSCAGLAIDYHRPNLGWTLPQQAVKSNINTLFAFLPSLGVIALLAAALLLLPFGAALPVSFLFLVVVDLLLWKVAVRQAEAMLRGN